MHPATPTPGLDPIYLASMVVLLLLVAAAIYMELLENRIPNSITYPALVVAIVLGYLPGGISLSSSVVGFAIGFGTLFAFYMFGGMGGGDVKLMGAVGALVGYPMVITTVVYTAVAGGVIAIFVMIWQLDFSRLGLLFSGKSGDVAATESVAGETGKKKTTIPYGIAIAIGCMLTLYIR
ncbi:MAG: prepilin peptidase [Verrucomicrobia bacterium]|nr:prepilin peptidase [Verrucomicrobiota bacterium]MDA1088553.1 prepilin peptidase [Verrucomicrobiota bacterium]